MEDYLETCVQVGKPPEKTYKGSFNVRFPAELHRKASIFAAIKKVTLSDYVRYAIDTTIAKEQNHN